MNPAICRTCGGSPGNHLPSFLDPDGIGDPGHKTTRLEQTTPTPIEQPDKGLEEKLAVIFDNYHGEFWNGNMLHDIVSLIESHTKASDLRTLETVAALLNGDHNQVTVTMNYVTNKLQMYRELEKETL